MAYALELMNEDFAYILDKPNELDSDTSSRGSHYGFVFSICPKALSQKFLLFVCFFFIKVNFFFYLLHY